MNKPFFKLKLVDLKQASRRGHSQSPLACRSPDCTSSQFPGIFYLASETMLDFLQSSAVDSSSKPRLNPYVPNVKTSRKHHRYSWVCPGGLKSNPIVLAGMQSRPFCPWVYCSICRRDAPAGSREANLYHHFQRNKNA